MARGSAELDAQDRPPHPAPKHDPSHWLLCSTFCPSSSIPPVGLRTWAPTAVLLWDPLSPEMGTSAEGWIPYLVVFVHLHTPPTRAGSERRTAGLGIYTESWRCRVASIRGPRWTPWSHWGEHEPSRTWPVINWALLAVRCQQPWKWGRGIQWSDKPAGPCPKMQLLQSLSFLSPSSGSAVHKEEMKVLEPSDAFLVGAKGKNMMESQLEVNPINSCYDSGSSIARPLLFPPRVLTQSILFTR